MYVVSRARRTGAVCLLSIMVESTFKPALTYHPPVLVLSGFVPCFLHSPVFTRDSQLVAGTKEDSDLLTDVDIDTQNQTQLSQEDGLDAVDDENLRPNTNDTATDEETRGRTTADNEVADVVGPILDKSGANVFDTDRPSDLVDESVMNEIFLKIFDNLIIQDGDDSPLSFTLEEVLYGKESSKPSKPMAINDSLDGLIQSVMLNDLVGRATASEELTLDDAVHVLIRSVLTGDIGSEMPSWNRVLDNDPDGVMLHKIHRVLFGRVELALVNVETFLYSM